MSATSSDYLTSTDAWKALQAHHEKVKNIQMRDLFAKDPKRFSEFSLNYEDILLDFSKNVITEETLGLLLALIKARNLPAMIEKMFTGEKINNTEDRAVLHVALRNRSNKPILVDGKDVMPEVNAVLQKMKKWTESIRSGEWKGYTGKSITDVVNIGKIERIPTKNRNWWLRSWPLHGLCSLDPICQS